ncbi:MAG: cytochrome c3 family protein, partial [Pseudomonas sp.]
RAKAQGGQRWFSLYPGQRFAPNDPLHWTGRYQNWNGMCADCHSTRLLKNYNDRDDSFASTWQEQNVGCQSCHGPGQAHVEWAKTAKPGEKTYSSATDTGLAVDYKALGSQGLVEQCAFCHSRRQTLGVGQLPGHPQLDQSLPATLRTGLYHADGQIDGEVYEYGSFTQSKMYAAGVGCTDCHNPHTNKVKIEGNGLCLQCHNSQPPVARFPSLQAKDYDSQAHHHHQPGTPGAQCVNCHMPTKTYMVVDPRRDHSLRIPRPDLASKDASPDACTSCHTDQKPQWAATAIEGWFGTPQRPPHYGENFHAVRSGQGVALSELNALLADKGKPAIVRATAAQQMADLGQQSVISLGWALKDKSALVRAYAVSGFSSVPPEQRLQPLLPLIKDPTLAVRDETLRVLADVPAQQLPAESRETFASMLADYEKRLRGNAE